MAMVTAFKVGDSVWFASYTKYLRCIIREVDVTSHKFKPDNRVFYRVEGGAESICTDEYLTKIN